MISRLVRQVLAKRSVVLGLIACVSIVAGGFAYGLTSDVGYRAFLGRDHPVVSRFDAFLDDFGAGAPLVAIYSCFETDPCSSVFDADALAMAYALGKELSRSDLKPQVHSPAVSVLPVPSAFGLEARRFVEFGEPVPDRARLARFALLNPSWVGRLVSADAKVGVVAMDLIATDSATNVKAVDVLTRAIVPFEKEGFRFRLVGNPIEFVIGGRELEADSARLVPVMVGLIAGVIVALFGSVLVSVAALVTVGVATLWTFGLQAWLGWPINSLSQALAPLLLVIGVADAMHFVSRYVSGRRGVADKGRRESPGGGTLAPAVGNQVEGAAGPSLDQAAGAVFWPCLLTTVTTCIAFAALGVSELESFRRFGVLASFGVLVSLGLTFTLLPALLSFRLPKSNESAFFNARFVAIVARLDAWAARRRTVVLALAAGLCVMAAFGLGHLRVDASFEDLYGSHSRIVHWIRFMEDHLRSAETLEVALHYPPFENASPSQEPRWASVVELEEALGKVDGISHPHSLADVAKHVAKMDLASPGGGRSRRVSPSPSFGDPTGAAAFYDETRYQHEVGGGEAPDAWASGDGGDEERTAREAPDLLEEGIALLGELRAADAGFERRWHNRDARSIRISAQAVKADQTRLDSMLFEIREAVHANLPAGWDATITGPVAVLQHMIGQVQATQRDSLFLVVGSIFLVLAVAFRSLVWALAAMVPTLAPVLIVGGIMGLVGMPLDPGRSIVAAVVLGVAVDDAIHLLTHCRQGMAQGMPPSVAIADAVAEVARPVVTTSVALVAGFCVLNLSSWGSVASFGTLSAVAIVAALVADLFLLPALVRTFGRG